VRHYDPPLALDGGPDGLAAYRRIAAEAARLMARDGLLVVEIGLGQAAAVAAIFGGADLALAGIRDDLAGVPRAVMARREA
jgi:release factor glutamine methyltransferase